MPNQHGHSNHQPNHQPNHQLPNQRPSSVAAVFYPPAPGVQEVIHGQPVVHSHRPLTTGTTTVVTTHGTPFHPPHVPVYNTPAARHTFLGQLVHPAQPQQPHNPQHGHFHGRGPGY